MVRCRPASLVVLGLAFTLGCHSAKEIPVEETAQRLRSLGTVYTSFTTSNGRPPRNEQELRGFIEKMKLGDPGKVLTSPGDGQPFVVVWGFDVRNRADGWQDKMTAEQGGAIYAYERVGNGGRRYVLYTHGGEQSLPLADFQQARFFGGHRPN